MLIAHVLSHSPLKRLDPFAWFPHCRYRQATARSHQSHLFSRMSKPWTLSFPHKARPWVAWCPPLILLQFVNVVLVLGSQKRVQYLRCALRYAEKRKINPPLNVLAIDTGGGAAGCPPSLCQPRHQVPSCRAAPSQAGVTCVLAPGCRSCPGTALGISPWWIQLVPPVPFPQLSRSLWITPLNSTPWIAPRFGAVSWLDESTVRPLTKLWSRTGCTKRPRWLHLLPASKQNMTQ